MGRRAVSVEPSAARLTESLRDIGYDFASAVADVVDNSIAAGAGRVEIVIEYDGASSRVFIADDGSGMTGNGVTEALRFGSRRDYARGELGRYGLGLKTASLSQCRRLTVVSRAGLRNITIRQLSLDVIAEHDEWLVVEPRPTAVYGRAREMLGQSTGTVLVWEQLDRVLQEQRPEGGWARRRIERLAERTVEHLSLVFHRFLSGEGVDQVDLVVNGEKVRPWSPFALDEPATVSLPLQRFEVEVGEAVGTATLRRYVLPSRNEFSSQAAFEAMSGPRKWNRQQGLYIYRAGRLVQWGGWAGLRGIDEHLKLARAALDFDTDLDAAFNISVSKMRVAIPAQLRQMLDRPVHELCSLADDTYRRAAGRGASPRRDGGQGGSAPSAATGLALRAAAFAAGEGEALKRILRQLETTSPEAAAALGLTPLPQAASA